MKFIFGSILIIFSLSLYAKPIRLLSWNVFMLPKPIKESLQVTRTNRIVQKLKEIPHEIVLLQEAFDGGFQDQLREKLAVAFPFSYYLPKEYLLYPVLGSGLLVLSKIPFQMIGHTYFSDCGSSDCLASKGAALLEFSWGEKLIHIATTHMQSGAAYARERGNQLAQIKTLFDQYRKKLVPQILVGDLNVEGKSAEIENAISKLNMKNVPLIGKHLATFGRKNKCYKTEWGKREWLDHIFYDSNGSNMELDSMRARNFTFQRRGNNCGLSDHLAIETVVSL